MYIVHHYFFFWFVVVVVVWLIHHYLLIQASFFFLKLPHYGILRFLSLKKVDGWYQPITFSMHKANKNVFLSQFTIRMCFLVVENKGFV